MDKEELKLLQQKVTLLRAEGKYKETIEGCFTLLNEGLKVNDYKSILTAYINFAASYYSVGDIEEAFNSMEHYEEICSKYGDDADYLNLYNVFFLIYEYMKDYDKAEGTLKKSIELGEKLEKYNIVSNGYSNYSHICLEKGDYAKALEMASKGLRAAKNHKPESLILEIRVKLNMAKSFVGLENISRSGAIIEEIINDPILESFVREKAQSFVLQGDWYTKQGMLESAFSSLTTAKELVESYQDMYLLKTIQEERIKLCDGMNDVHLGYTVQKEYIALLNDINQKELALKAQKIDIKHTVTELEKKVNIDHLTGIYNRHYLEKVTNDWLENDRDTKKNIVCIVFDIDNFKKINDEFGHLFGDEVIKLVGRSCEDLMEENQIFGRYGGDEFVIILNKTSVEAGKRKAEQIYNNIRNLSIMKGGKTVRITPSIGVSTNHNGSLHTFEEIFHDADLALYKAKQNGKNQIFISEFYK